MKYLLLRPDQASYSVEHGQDFVSVQLEGGMGYYRLDQQNTTALVEVQWTLDTTKFNYFFAFYRTSISSGADWFSIDLILDRDAPRRHTAHFKSAPRVVGVDGLSRVVAATLEIEPEFENGSDNLNAVLAVERASSLLLRARFYENFAKDYSPFDHPLLALPGADAGDVGAPEFAPSNAPNQSSLVFRNPNTTTSAYLSATNSPTSSVAYTIMIWYFRETNPNFPTYLCWGDGGVNDIQLVASGGSPGLFAGHASLSLSGGAGVNNVWSHAALTYDLNDSQRMRLYLNGIQVATTTGVGTIGAPTALRFMGSGQTLESVSGYATDMIVFGKVLSAQQIAAYVASGELPGLD